MPKNNSSAPLLSDVADAIHVIWAVVIPRSRPIKDDITVTDPVSSAPIAIAMVAVRTNRTS